MFLTEANVLRYLADRQFGDFETAVSGEFAVRSLTRRNRNLHVTCGPREYLVKQANRWDFGGRTSVEREAAFYRQRETRKQLANLVPQCYAYDPPNSVLVLEFLPRHTDLYDAPDCFAPETGRLCGEAMGAFHREMESGSLASEFPGSVPWVLSFHEVAEDLVEPSAGQRELAREVKKYAEFGRALDRLRAEWRADTLTHGDWKLENCLVSPDRDRLRVVDWEFVWGRFRLGCRALFCSRIAIFGYTGRWNFRSRRFSRRCELSSMRTRNRGGGSWRNSPRAPSASPGRACLQAAFESLDEAEEMTGPGSAA